MNNIKNLLEATVTTELLNSREKQLVGLAVTLTRGCTICTQGRIERAVQADFTRPEIEAAIELVCATNAGVVLRTALTAMEDLALPENCPT